MSKYPILERLEKDRVFYLLKQRGPVDMFKIVEGCDNYFDCDLTKSELLDLSQELFIFAHQGPEE